MNHKIENLGRVSSDWFTYHPSSEVTCLICVAVLVLNEIWHFQVKSRAMELATLIENEDGVAASVDAFHRHLPSELPLPNSSLGEDEQPNPLQWFFLQIGKLCCLPCGL